MMTQAGFYRSSALALVAVLCLLLVACNAEDADPAEGQDEDATEDTESDGGEDEGSDGAADGEGAGDDLASQLPEPEVTEVALAVQARSISSYQAQLAADLGLYEKYGLDAEMLFFEGNRAIQGFVAGELDFLRAAVEPVFLTAGSETEAVLLGSFYNRFLDDFVAAPHIESADDLRGERIAVSGFGGLSHREVLLALEALEVPEDEVEIVEIGGEGDRVAALQAGSVGAAPMASAAREALEEEGFNVLLRLAEDVDDEVVLGALMTSRTFADENPNTTLRVVAAVMEATEYMWADPEHTAELFADWAQLDSPDEALEELEVYKSVAQRDLRWTTEGLVRAQEFIGIQEPGVLDVDPASVEYADFLAELEEMGFREQLNTGGE